ncbi:MULTISPECIES: 5-carboxymethyl-2-hydroxymuconate Delta-isomerase [Ruegeria]|uniref:5-carboxymethyl-2-hydroxymuconate Delta-isomerase n=1 Tax=Ruegeria TaxID=97050 RepID=UPI00147FEE10|nr:MULTISPECIES: 5-carboxymethyl-2-hydroxymuconate isomerase [Ruegeria]UWR06395.1 5-carboxymethyl-2-hydroxymuconate isomerase [Ruegeria sp. B32]
MPHVVLEFSAGLEQSHDFQAICEELYTVLAEHEQFDAPTLKIRAMPIPYSHIGTDPQTFIHATLFLMQGRDEPTRTELNAIILDVLTAAAPTVGSITVRDVEMNRATYAKRLAT